MGPLEATCSPIDCMALGRLQHQWTSFSSILTSAYFVSSLGNPQNRPFSGSRQENAAPPFDPGADFGYSLIWKDFPRESQVKV